MAKLVDDVSPYAQRAITPAERNHLAALVPQYEEALRPAPQAAIQRSIGMLALAFPQQKGSDAEAEARLKLYAQGLGDIPGDLLSEACREAIRSHTFFPTVAELRKLCKDFYSRQFRLSRIKHLIAKHDREYRPPIEDRPLTDAERAELDAIMRRLNAAA